MSGLQSRCGAPLTGVVVLLMMTPAHGFFNGNKSIQVGDGEQSAGHSTVNGSISVGRDARIDGSLETVNGTIRVSENSRLGDARTVNGSVNFASGVSSGNVGSVNGSIRIAENVTIEGDVSIVNGRISIDEDSRVSGDVSNVNGEIRVAHAEIGGDLRTVNGDVRLTDHSVLAGELRVENPDNRGQRSREKRKPTVVVGPGTKVGGGITLEREVDLYISDSAEVGEVRGVMSMDDAIRFSGSEP